MNKSNFAIIIDNNEKVPTLVETIHQLNFVERNSRQQDTLKQLLKGLDELLVFDKKSTYDYEFAKSNPLIKSYLSDIFNGNNYRLSKDFDKIIEQLYLFAGKEKENKKDMVIDITITLPKAQKPKRKVRVFSNFVKVGFRQFSIKIDPFTGYEYVLIDGKRYEIARDFFNRGVLVEI